MQQPINMSDTAFKLLLSTTILCGCPSARHHPEGTPVTVQLCLLANAGPGKYLYVVACEKHRFYYWHSDMAFNIGQAITI